MAALWPISPFLKECLENTCVEGVQTKWIKECNVITGKNYLTPRHVEGITRIVYQELASSLNYSIYQFTILTELISCLKIWTLKIVSKFLSILVSHYEKIFWVIRNFCTWIIYSTFEKIMQIISTSCVHKNSVLQNYFKSCINMFKVSDKDTCIYD